jgi:hypothetical protein
LAGQQQQHNQCEKFHPSCIHYTGSPGKICSGERFLGVVLGDFVT